MWKQGLCGCFSNCSLSMIACCTAPLAIGKNAEAVGEAHPVLWALSVLGAPCVAGALLRGLIRKKKGIEGSFFMDALLWWCCSPCALCQETVETGTMDYLQQPELQSIERDVHQTTG